MPGIFTPSQFAGKLVELAEAEDQVPRAVIQDASLLIKTTVMARTPKRLSGVGRKGAALNVRYKTGPSAGGWQSVVFATGPFQLWERDTQPHVEPRQRTRSGADRYVVIPNASAGDGVFSTENHPGTRGHHTFEQGVLSVVPIIEAKFKAGAYLAASEVFL